MRITIPAKLYASFALMSVLVLSGAVLITRFTQTAHDNYERLSQNTHAAAVLSQAQTALWQLRYGFPQFMVGDAAAQQKIIADEPLWYAEIEDALKEYRSIATTEEARRALEALNASYKQYIGARPHWFELYRSGKVQEAAEWRAATTTPFGAATAQNFSDLIALQYQMSEATRQAIDDHYSDIRRAALAFTILTLLGAAAVGLFIARRVIRPLEQLSVLTQEVQEAGIKVNTSVTDIVSTSTQQQATATEIAATTTEIGATSREISATSKELLNTITEVSTTAEQAASLAGDGQQGLARMEETMRQVSEASSSINSRLIVLNEKAGNITQVVTTITKIADQTNLLSLNAAIEAEKAGEAGRGFAVVATEIRRLADQTAVATYDIEQTVKEIQSAVAAGVMGMDKFSEEVHRGIGEVRLVGTQLTQIIQQVQATAPRIVAVSDGMQAQATGAEQISDALMQLTEASQQTAQSLRQSGEAINELTAISSSLSSAVTRLKLDTAA